VVVKEFPHDNAPLRASESSSTFTKIPATELQASSKPNEYPDALVPVTKLDNVFDAQPEEIAASETEEPVLQQTVHDRSPRFPFVAVLTLYLS
jgi:hypothetical protein